MNSEKLRQARRPPPTLKLQIWALRERAGEADLASFCSVMGIRYAPLLRIMLGESNEATAGLFLPDFGGPRGILINPGFPAAPAHRNLRAQKQGFWDAGFGHCRLSGRPRASFTYYREMLSTFGWTGSPAERPAWLELPSDEDVKHTWWLGHEWNADEERLLVKPFESTVFPSRRARCGAVFGWVDTFPPPHLAEEPEWLAIEHQSAGLSCLHPTVAGIPVEMNARFSDFAASLCGDYYGGSGGWLMPPAPPEIFEHYRGRVAVFGLDVSDEQHAAFMEAVYPIDLADSEIGRVTDNPEPLLRLRSRSEWAPAFAPPNLYIIAENSD
jgi:hypothetical protein